jgi:Tfp pilus assembly protein PilN
LKQNQKGPVRIMDRISQDLPDLVWLDRMTLDGTHITLDGRALNPNAFANYVEAIKADPMFDEPEVNGVTEQAGGQGGPSVYTWGMSFNFKTPPAAPAGGAGGAAAPTGTTPTTTAAPGM